MARERYLWNIDEDTIQEPSKEEKEVSQKQKIKNFWDYNKWYFLIGVIFFIVISWAIFEVTAKVEPDYNIAFLTEKMYPNEVIDKIEEKLKDSAKDSSGNKAYSVKINQYLIEPNGESLEINMQTVGGSQLSLDLSSFKSAIFICNDDILYKLKQQQDLFLIGDYTTNAKGKDENQKTGFKWYDSELLSSIDFNFKDINGISYNLENEFKDLNLMLINFKGTKFEGDPIKSQYYNRCRNLFYNMLFTLN